MRKPLEFYSRYEPAEMAFNIYIRTGDRIVEPVTFSMFEPKTHAFVEPSMKMQREEAQALFQSLWDAGLRPNDGEGTTGHVAALKYHLEDMRRLVFEDNTPKIIHNRPDRTIIPD